MCGHIGDIVAAAPPLATFIVPTGADLTVGAIAPSRFYTIWRPCESSGAPSIDSLASRRATPGVLSSPVRSITNLVPA